MDATVSFSSLDNEVILKVVDKFLIQLETQLHDKKVDASFTKDLKIISQNQVLMCKWVQDLWLDLFKILLERLFADELLFGKLVNGGEVEIDIDAKEEVVLNIKDNEKASV